MGGIIVNIVNCALIAEPDWRFLEDRLSIPNLAWTFLSCTPVTFLDKAFQKLNISRYKACFLASLMGRDADFIITHLPRASCWTALFSGFLRARASHLAFAFNFTDLPHGHLRKIMNRSFQNIDRFVVFSNAEKQLYADYFNIALENIDFIHWAMDVPAYSPDIPVIEGKYICAVGGEGRDYKLLIDAMCDLPEVPLVIVARPHNLEGLELPPNVQAYTNMDYSKFWNVVRFSRFSIIPLRDSQTNCGHITLVGSMLLGRAIVTTESKGTADYIQQNENALVGPPSDSGALASNIERLWNDKGLRSRLAMGGKAFVEQNCRIDRWVEYLTNYINAEIHSQI